MTIPPTDRLSSTSNTLSNRPTSSTAVGSNGSVNDGMLRAPSTDGLRVPAQKVVDGPDPNEDIHDTLRGVRLDELVTLSQSSGAMHVVKEDSSFPASLFIPLNSYLKYIWETWSNIFALILTHELRKFTFRMITPTPWTLMI